MNYFYTLLSFTCCAPLLVSCLELPSKPSYEGKIVSQPFGDLSLISDLSKLEKPPDVLSSDSIKPLIQTRNLIFVAADSYMQFSYRPIIDTFYSNDYGDDLVDLKDSSGLSNLRVETLIWWRLWPKLRQIYDTVLHIPYSEVKYTRFVAAIKMMENRGETFDIILLTHGYKNHLSTGSNYFFSKKEFSKLGKLRHLNLVYMQSCSSGSLANSWHNVGAEEVIGFAGLNKNVLFPEFFLNSLIEHKIDTDLAVEMATSNFTFDLKHNDFYLLILDQLGISVDNYMQQFFQKPILTYDSNR